MRSLICAFGAEVAWNQETSTALIVADGKKYLLDIDLANLSASLDEDAVADLKLIRSRTYIPLSFLKDILNYEISWDEENRTLTAIKNPGAATVFKNLPEAPEIPETPEYKVIDTFTGVASWYGGKFSGRGTYYGEIFNENDLTAAHRTLPYNTYLRVTFLQSNKSVIVRINDRGPHIAGRILDLSKGAAEKIGLKPHGLGTVKVEVLADYQANA